MTTITEILTEAFNRVKSEHGVTLSRVEYVDTGGVLGLNFKAAGTAKGTPLVVHRVAEAPNIMFQDYVADLNLYKYNGVIVRKNDKGDWEWLDGKWGPIPSTGVIKTEGLFAAPYGTTHVGNMDDYTNEFWMLTKSALYVHTRGKWRVYNDSNPVGLARHLRSAPLHPVLTEQQLEELLSELPTMPDDATHVYDGREWAMITDESKVAVWDESKNVYLILSEFNVSLLHTIPINPA